MLCDKLTLLFFFFFEVWDQLYGFYTLQLAIFFRLKLLIQRFILIFIFQQLLLVSPTHTFEEILEECSLKLELNAKALYTAQGALVDNVVFIRCELQFFIC